MGKGMKQGLPDWYRKKASNKRGGRRGSFSQHGFDNGAPTQRIKPRSRKIRRGGWVGHIEDGPIKISGP